MDAAAVAAPATASPASPAAGKAAPGVSSSRGKLHDCIRTDRALRSVLFVCRTRHLLCETVASSLQRRTATSVHLDVGKRTGILEQIHFTLWLNTTRIRRDQMPVTRLAGRWPARCMFELEENICCLHSVDSSYTQRPASELSRWECTWSG